MTCMEVWGGSEPVDAAVTLSGLDAWVYSRPYGEQAEAGGDVYYVSACATGRINRLLVADVSGHGHAVRDIAVGLRDLMRQFVNYLDQAKFVAQMNHQFMTASADNIFATAIVTTFFAPTRTLSICNAGHPPPLIYRAAAREWSFLQVTHDGCNVANIPLGIMDMEECAQFAVDLEVGDLVLVYTDALSEAIDPVGQMLGLGGLLNLLNAMGPPPNPQALVPALLETINQRTSGGLRADDVTTLLIRANGTGANPSFAVRLLAPFRLVKGIVQCLCGKGPVGWPEFSLVNLGGAMLGPLNRLKATRGPRR
jgi:serine phosphatase RsbU (regulator of sigma subunit)